MKHKDTILEVNNLKISLENKNESICLLNGISFKLLKNEILGIVGESGCGKSLTANTIMRLLDLYSLTINSGELLYNSNDLLSMPIDQFNNIRGKEISIVFQDPMTALNPLLTIGTQLMELVARHTRFKKTEALQLCQDVLAKLGINNPRLRLKQYPHELSGGLRQRIMIASALLLNPKILIADEPTTALDVTTQAIILNLIKELSNKQNISVLFISHDLSVISEISHRVLVMYAGEIVELASTEFIINNPKHPYTAGLLNSMPNFTHDNKKPLYTIPGQPPDIFSKTNGCSFSDRCSYAREICCKEKPTLIETEPEHFTACWLNTLSVNI